MIRFLPILILVFFSISHKAQASHYFSIPYFTSENFGFVDPDTVNIFGSTDDHSIVQFTFSYTNFYWITTKNSDSTKIVPEQISTDSIEECIVIIPFLTTVKSRS